MLLPGTKDFDGEGEGEGEGDVDDAARWLTHEAESEGGSLYAFTRTCRMTGQGLQICH